MPGLDDTINMMILGQHGENDVYIRYTTCIITYIMYVYIYIYVYRDDVYIRHV